MVVRYNMYPAAAINIVPQPGVSSGQAIDRAERVAHAELGRVIERARAGKWESAAERLHEFMKGQERPEITNQNEPWRRGKKAGRK